MKLQFSIIHITVVVVVARYFVQILYIYKNAYKSNGSRLCTNEKRRREETSKVVPPARPQRRGEARRDAKKREETGRNVKSRPAGPPARPEEAGRSEKRCEKTSRDGKKRKQIKARFPFHVRVGFL